MPTRCKFRCNSVNKEASTFSFKDEKGDWQNEPRFLFGVKMTPVYSDNPDSENKAFWDATPSGSFEMSSIHPDLFEPGKEYFLDISPAE